MILAWCLMLMELAVDLVQPLLMAQIIDHGIMKNDLTAIVKWGSILLGTSFFAFAAGILNSFASSHVGQNFGVDVRARMFEKIQAYSFANFNQFPTASLVTRLTNDVTQLQNMVFMSLRIMLKSPLMVLFGTIMALYVNAKLAVIFVILIPFMVLFLIWIMKKGAVLFQAMQQRLDQVNGVMRRNLTGMKLIKAFLRSEQEEHQFEEASLQLKNRTMTALRVIGTATPILLIVMNMSILFILWFGNMEINAGHTKVGELVAVLNYGLRIIGFLSMFSFIISVFSRARASANRIVEVLDVEIDIVDQESAAEKSIQHGQVKFENVSFHYPNSQIETLDHISFTVEAGEKIAILGATGSGKTSLFQLIPRLYDATEGHVLIDGIDVRDMRQEDLRNQIGFVPQEAMLLSGTIKENIAWGKPTATDEEIIEAARHAQIHETIIALSDQYYSVIGQKGANLSGGQKQRISIARALIRKPKILLLDDSTSALDLKTEAKFLEALKNYSCTTFLITQKISTAMKADRIFILDNGQLFAKGTHEQLVADCPLYQKMVQSQFGKDGLRYVEASK